jgi:hypothetical protein
MDAVPLSRIRQLAVKNAINEFGEHIDRDAAANHPFSHHVFNRVQIPLLRYRTCEHVEDCIEKLPPLPDGISPEQKQGDVVSVGGAAFVVLENHKADINEMILTQTNFVDVSR